MKYVIEVKIFEHEKVRGAPVVKRFFSCDSTGKKCYFDSKTRAMLSVLRRMYFLKEIKPGPIFIGTGLFDRGD